MRTNRREVPTTSLFWEHDIVYTLPGKGPMVLMRGFGARGSQSFKVCSKRRTEQAIATSHELKNDVCTVAYSQHLTYLGLARTAYIH